MKKSNLEISDEIKKARDYVCNYDAAMATLGKVNAPIYIFRSKNFYDMKDVQEIKAGPIADATKPRNEQDIFWNSVNETQVFFYTISKLKKIFPFLLLFQENN